MKRTALALLVVLLLVLLAPPGPAAQSTADPADVPWWDDRWHFRVPVSVTLDIPSPITGESVAQGGRDYPVEVEIDIKEAVAEFVPFTRIDATLDEGSIRVVEHTPKPGGGHVVAEVPSVFMPGVYYTKEAPFEYDQHLQVSASTFGTVRFTMPGFTGPGETRTFHVYLDLEEFGLKDPEPYTQGQLGRLQSLYWKQPGHEFYARMIGAEARMNYKSVFVPVATQDDTTYQIWDADSGTPWFDEPRKLDTFDYDEHERPTGRGLGDNVVVRADKPIVLYHGAHHDKGDKPGFWDVATSGGLAGTDFWMPSLWLNGMTVDFYFIAGDQDATVTVQTMDHGEEVVLRTLQVPANSYRLWQNTQQYTIWHVTSTAPIMVQRPGTMTYQQLPAANGAPMGSVHFGAHSGQEGPSNAELNVVGVAPGPLDIYTLPSTNGAGVDLWRSAEHGAGFDGDFQAFDSPRPVMKTVGLADSVAFGSSRTDGSQQPPGDIVFLGGRNGQEFYTHIPPAGLCGCPGAIIFPFFPETHVRIDHWTDATGWVAQETVLLGPDGENARKELFEVAPARIVADKPVAVQLNTNPWHDHTQSSRGVFGDMLAGRLLPAQVGLGDVEYRGCIPGVFDRSAPSAPSPSIRYVGAGEPAAFPLAVHNLAGVSGQSVEVRYHVEMLVDETRREGLGWTLDIEPDDGSGRSAGLVQSSPDPVPFTISITTAEASEVGSRLSVRVEASCSDAPGFVFAYELRAQVRPERGVDIQHVDPADQVRVMQPGATVEIPLRVTSLANLEDTFQMSASNPLQSIGWTTGIEPAELTLPPGGSGEVVLMVTAPQNDVSTILRATARAASASDPNTYDDAVTEIRINPRYAVGLDAIEDRREVLPGETATFSVLVRNDGNGEHDINVTFEGALPDGWNVVPPWRLLERVGIGQTNLVVVEVQTPAGARPHVPRTIQATATSIGIDDTEFVSQQRLELVTVVKQVHDLRAPAAAVGGIVDTQGTLTTGFTIENAGNGDEDIRLRIGEGTPPGWQVFRLSGGQAEDIRLSRLSLGPGATLDLALRIQVPDATLAGSYELVLEVVGGGEPVRVAVPVTVPEAALMEARAVQPVLETTPSQSRDFEVVVSNLGNIEETYTLEVLDSEWRWEVFPPALTLLPTQSQDSSFTVTMLPPADLARSATQRQFTFRVSGSSGAQAHVEALLVVVRPDLNLQAVTPFEDLVPRDGFVHLEVLVRNDGEAQADQAVVRAYVDGKAFGAPEVLQKIPNGGSKLAVFSIPASALQGGVHALQVQVDPDDLISESDEDNNALQAFMEAPADSRLPAAVWAAAALGTVALAGGAFTAWRMRRT